MCEYSERMLLYGVRECRWKVVLETGKRQTWETRVVGRGNPLYGFGDAESLALLRPRLMGARKVIRSSTRMLEFVLIDFIPSIHPWAWDGKSINTNNLGAHTRMTERGKASGAR